MPHDALALFDCSPENFPWRQPIAQEIQNRRAKMSNRLTFDLLLSSAGIQHPETFYPPVDEAALDRLLVAISESEFDDLKKNSLLYWLLKWHQDGREDIFQVEKCIPPQFVILADVYWLLDTGHDLVKAVGMLSDPRLNADHPSKVLEVLSLAENPLPLILKYIRTAKPVLLQPEDVDLYAIAMAESSMMEAWQFQRSFPENSIARTRLITKILDWCLSPKPRTEPLKHLLAFPFTPFEQAFIHEYALHPPPEVSSESAAVIQDLMCIRLIQNGQYAAAIRLDREFLSSVPKPSARMQRAIQERRGMMDEILAAMPPVEREILENETRKSTRAALDPRTFLLSSSRSLAASHPLSPVRSSTTHHLHHLHTPPNLHTPPGLHTPPINSVQPSTYASSGSANTMRNAFYEPASLNGLKRALGHESPRPVSNPPSVPAPSSPEQDVDMESEPPPPSPEPEQAPAPLEYSVFEKKTQRRPRRAESQTRLPPGAFVESDEEEPEHADEGRQQSQTASPPPSPPEVEKPSRKTRQARSKEPEMSRSIPGGLTADDHENEQDQLGPLPPSRTKRAPRKGRVSRQPSQEGEGSTVQPRRSSRLAATSSSDSKASEPSRPRTREKR